MREKKEIKPKSLASPPGKEICALRWKSFLRKARNTHFHIAKGVEFNRDNGIDCKNVNYDKSP